MAFFQFTKDKVVKRLCWVMVGANLFDKLCTLLGQPDSYWHHPEAVREGNVLPRFFLIHGWPVYLLYSLIYISAVFFILSIIPRRLALVGLFSEILAHYFAACTWLVYHWHFGVCASGIYSIILGVVFVQWAYPTPSTAKILSDELDA